MSGSYQRIILYTPDLESSSLKKHAIGYIIPYPQLPKEGIKVSEKDLT